MAKLIDTKLVDILRDRFRLDWKGIHGASHWSRVRRSGLFLAGRIGPEVNVRVVELFAFLHDSCRHNDGHDPMHGARAAASIAELVQDLPALSREEHELLAYACTHHSDRCKCVGTRTAWTSDGWESSPVLSGYARRQHVTRKSYAGHMSEAPAGTCRPVRRREIQRIACYVM